MTSISHEKPCFDLEFFLQSAGETRLDGATMDACLALWDDWSELLTCRLVEAHNRAYLAIWLGEEVENAVDDAWEQSPSRGFLMNALAQTLCMCAVHDHIPEIEEAGCAPVPLPTEELAGALREAGLPARAGTGLEFSRRYAVVTRHPFGGACDICALQSSCPRSGQATDSMFEIG